MVSGFHAKKYLFFPKVIKLFMHIFFYNFYGFIFCLYIFDSSEVYNGVMNEIWNTLTFLFKQLASCLNIID